MADPQTLPLILRNSVTAGAVPALTEFDLNTFVVNRNDGLLYWKDAAGALQSLDLKLRNVTPAGTYVRADVAQNLLGSQRRQAKANLGALGSGYNYLTGASSLTSASVGQLTFMGTGGGAVTLPTLATVKDSDILVLVSWSGSTIIKSAEASGTAMISFQGQNVDQFTIRQGQTAFLQTDGTRWYVFGYSAVQGDSPSFNEPQGASRTQMIRARLNIGAGPLKYPGQVNATTALDASAYNCLIWTNGGVGGQTITLPPRSAAVEGDQIEICNYSASVSITIATGSNNGGIFSSNGQNAASIVLGPGQSICLTTDTSNWVARYRALAPEFAAALAGAAFTGAISTPSLLVAGRAVYGPANGGTVGGNNADLDVNASSRLSYSFVATGNTAILLASGHCSNNSASAADIYWRIRLYDQTAGNAVVQDKVEVSYAVPNAGSTAPRSVSMVQGGLTLGRTYAIGFEIWKAQAVGPIYPNNLQMQHINW